jgi:hypothetical protein
MQPQQEHFIEFWLQDQQQQQQSDYLGCDSPLGLHVELSVSYLDRTPELMMAKARLSSWASEIWMATVYFSEWDF